MRTIAVAGTDLFTVAARELGDATQWYRIAAANSLTDPMIFGVMTLQIPLSLATGAVSNGIPDQ